MFKVDKIPNLLNEICDKFDRGNYRKILPEFKESVEEIFLKVN